VSDWMLDRPFIALAVLLGPVALCTPLGPLTAWLLVSHHIASNNVPVGLGLGFGGCLIGLAVSLVIAWRLNVRFDRHRA